MAQMLFAQEQKKASITIEQIEGPKPYTNLDLNNDPGNFQFAIVTDRTGGHRPGVFLDGVKKLNLLQPEFVMSVGDLIEGYTENEKELDRQWKEFNGFIDQLDVPFFYVPGNHDITNKVMEEKWKELYGKTYYHFVYQDVLFLCLNTEDNYRGSRRGTIGDEQYEYIKQALAENPDVRWTLVFMHQPLWNQEAETLRWNDVEKLLADRKHTVYVGHHHRYVKYERNNGKYFILATTGGGSGLRGPRLGEFDHVMWVTMTDNGPIMANLMLEGIWDENVVTEEMKEFFVPLVNGRPITVQPILLEKDKFNQATSQLKLTNDSNVPMKVALELKANTTLSTNIASNIYEIQPNSVEIVDLKVNARNETSLSNIEDLKMIAQVSYHPENLPEVKFEVKQTIRPEQIEFIKQVDKKVKIDGKLNEWKSLNHIVDQDDYLVSDPFSHNGPKDGSFKFSVAYDEKYLYVAAQVTDDEILVNDGTRPYRQDGFHINLDARTAQVAATGRGEWGQTLYLGQSPSSSSEKEDQLFRPKSLPEGTMAVTVKTKDGYITEVAIPVEYIKEKQGADWETVRLNISVTDYDNDKNHQSTIFWRPEWRGNDNYVGSGIFRRVN